MKKTTPTTSLVPAASHREPARPCETRTSGRSYGPCRCGAAALEMALIGSLVLLLIVGILDLGIAVYSCISIAESARAGARYAAVHGSKATLNCGPTANDSNVEALVRSHAAGLMKSRLTVNSSWPEGGNTPGSRVNVSTYYDYPLITTWFFGKPSIKLCASQSMIILH